MSLRRKLIIIPGIIGVVVILCGIGVYKTFEALLNFADTASICDPTTPETTEEIGQFKFPPSARILRSSCFGLQGIVGYTEFEMSPDDLDYFVSHLQIEAPLSDTVIPDNSDMATRVSSVTSFLHGNYDITYKNGNTFSQSVFIDTSNPAQYVVTINFSGG